MRMTAATKLSTDVERRLADEQIIWLTSVRPDEMPEPNPVWFLWDGKTFLIYGLRDSHKLAHIAHNPKVALHLNSDNDGGHVVVFTGEARIESTTASLEPAYLAKYQGGIRQIGMTPESFARDYGVAIRVTPRNVRTF
jgi:PPOX class probable F420-dependent enzyme